MERSILKKKYKEKLGNWFSASGTVSYDAYRNDDEMIGLIGIAGLRYEFKGENSVDGFSDRFFRFCFRFWEFWISVYLSGNQIKCFGFGPISQNKSKTLPTEQTRSCWNKMGILS